MKKTVFSSCLILASVSVSSAANVAFEFSDTENVFNTLGISVSDSDVANGTPLTVQTDNPGGNLGDLNIATNGEFGTGFGLNSGNGNGLIRFQIDLGGLFAVDTVNTFSFGSNGNMRSNQIFALFGSALADPIPFDETPNGDFELIAIVNFTGPDASANQFGASTITDIDGEFQNLLFVAEPTNGVGGGEHTIFREFDVFGTPVPEPSSTALLGLGFLGLITRRRR